MIALDSLVFDPASFADGPTLGAYLLDSAGQLITSTTVGGTQSLDVNVTQQPAQFDEDSAHASGDKGNFILAVRNDANTSLVDTDGDYAPLQVNANGELRVNATVDMPGDYAEDSAHVSGDIGLYMLSVREDTLAASTNATGDYQSFKTDALGRLWINKAAQSAAYGATSVASTATDIVGTDLTNRTRIIIQNIDNKSVFIGHNASVTTANGIRLSPGASIEVDAGPGLNWHGITAAGTADVRYLEVA